MKNNGMLPGISRQEPSQKLTNHRSDEQSNRRPAAIIHNMFANFTNLTDVDQSVEIVEDLEEEFLNYARNSKPDLFRTEHKTIEKEIPRPCHQCIAKTRAMCIRCNQYVCGSCEINPCFVPKDQICKVCGGICTMVPDLSLKMCCSDFARSTMAFAQKMPESREKQVALNQIRDIKYCQNCINRLVAADIEGAVR